MMDPDVERYRNFPIIAGLVRPRTGTDLEDSVSPSIEEQRAVEDECAAIRAHEEMSSYLRKAAKDHPKS